MSGMVMLGIESAFPNETSASREELCWMVGRQASTLWVNCSCVAGLSRSAASLWEPGSCLSRPICFFVLREKTVASWLLSYGDADNFSRWIFFMMRSTCSKVTLMCRTRCVGGGLESESSNGWRLTTLTLVVVGTDASGSWVVNTASALGPASGAVFTSLGIIDGALGAGSTRLSVSGSSINLLHLCASLDMRNCDVNTTLSSES